MTYGSVGSYIGHEITHEFTDANNELDKVGNVVDWWNAVSKANFTNRVQCLIEQANNYTVLIGLKVFDDEFVMNY